MVHRSQGVLAPASDQLRSEVAIIVGIGRALVGDLVRWDELVGNYDRIRDLIARVIPGFEDFNARVRTPNGWQNYWKNRITEWETLLSHHLLPG